MRRLALLSLASLALAPTALAAPFPPDVVEHGRQLALAADCAACHDAPGRGAPFAGGDAIPTPLGPIYASNITPSKAFGIGDYTEADFARALRKGVRRDGAHLYPAMPYASYSQLSDADVHALYVYAEQGVAPVDAAAPKTRLPFPMSVRASMAVWNALFLKDVRFAADPSRSPAWNRGAYLITLEHCADCHSPRGLLLNASRSRAFAGGSLGQWYAPNITSDPVSGLGGWSRGEIVDLLKTGRVPGKSVAAGPMAEVVERSTSQLPDPDLEAMAEYLATLPPVADPGVVRPAYRWGGPARLESALRGAAGPVDGAALYSGLCASCHGVAGDGTRDHAFPSLFENSTVGAPRPDNLVATILRGVDRDAGGAHGLMPSFGPRSYVESLSDAQVAALATYVRAAFGPGGAPLTAAKVALLRRGGAPAPILAIAQAGLAAGVLVLSAALAWIGVRLIRFRRRRRP